MHTGTTKVHVILASIGVLVSNLTTNEVCALLAICMAVLSFSLTCYKFSNKSLKIWPRGSCSEPNLPAS